MSAPQTHPTELLLDFAYQELDPAETRRIEAHLAGCPACTRELEGIRGVRKAMAPLTPEPPPDAGLESLLAYAEKSARTHREAKPRRTWALGWVGLAATAGLVVVLAQQARRSLPEADALSEGNGGPIAYQKSLSAPAPASFGASARDQADEEGTPPPPPPPPLAQRRGDSAREAKKAKTAPGLFGQNLRKDQAVARERAPAGKAMRPAERKAQAPEVGKAEQAARAEHRKKRSRKVALAEVPAELEEAGFDDAFGKAKGAGTGALGGAAAPGRVGGVVGGGVGGIAGGRVADALPRTEVADAAPKPTHSRAAAARPAPAAPTAATSGAAAPAPASVPAAEPRPTKSAAEARSQDPREAELARLEAALPLRTGEARARTLEQICALQQALGQDAKARATLQVLLRDFPGSAEAARAKQRMAPVNPRGE